MAARATREPKAHERAEDLLPRWQAELAGAGYPPIELAAVVDQARLAYLPPSPEVVAGIAEQLLAPGGRLAEEKTFSRSDVVVAVAPRLHGLAVSYLDSAVERVLSHEDAVELPAVAGAREPVWAAACVLADERRVAELAEALAERTVPALSPAAAADAVLQTELARGFRLSDRQSEVATGLLTSGHQVDFVVGVAGAGKTSTLSAVRAGFEAPATTSSALPPRARRPRRWAKGPASAPGRWPRSPGAWAKGVRC